VALYAIWPPSWLETVALNQMALSIGEIGRRIPHASMLALFAVHARLFRGSFCPTTDNFFIRFSALGISLAGAFNRHFYWLFIAVGRGAWWNRQNLTPL
jgi:hypothetical protein